VPPARAWFAAHDVAMALAENDISASTDDDLDDSTPVRSAPITCGRALESAFLAESGRSAGLIRRVHS